MITVLMKLCAILSLTPSRSPRNYNDIVIEHLQIMLINVTLESRY